MTDALKQRAEKFREKFKRGDIIFLDSLQAKSQMFEVDDLLAELDWAEKNRPTHVATVNYSAFCQGMEFTLAFVRSLLEEPKNE